jgi:hypothetical protein
MPALPAEDLTIDQRGCQYSPHVVVAPLGSTVAFVNSDDIAHNVRVQSGATDSMMLNRAQPVRGRRDTMRVETTGPASVGCDYHPWMNAYVFGVDNPYYALTAPDGTFTIAGIPPGTYTLRLWLNGAGFQARTDNQGKVIRYAFADPYTREQTVKVEPDGTARVGFAIPLVRGRKG